MPLPSLVGSLEKATKAWERLAVDIRRAMDVTGEWPHPYAWPEAPLSALMSDVRMLGLLLERQRGSVDAILRHYDATGVLRVTGRPPRREWDPWLYLVTPLAWAPPSLVHERWATIVASVLRLVRRPTQQAAFRAVRDQLLAVAPHPEANDIYRDGVEGLILARKLSGTVGSKLQAMLCD